MSAFLCQSLGITLDLGSLGSTEIFWVVMKGKVLWLIVWCVLEEKQGGVERASVQAFVDLLDAEQHTSVLISLRLR